MKSETLASKNWNQKLGETTGEDAGGMQHRVKMMAEPGKLNSPRKTRKTSRKGKK